jgi:hypothetical protein
VSVALLLGLLGLPGAQAQEPGADAAVSQFAYATTIVQKGGDDYMYLVGAERFSQVGGRTRTTAFAKRTKCLTLEKKHMKLIVCAAFVFPKRIPENAFEFDLLMDSARVRIKDKGRPTAMKWTGRGTPEPYAAPYANVAYGGAYAEMYRMARANGKILGERYPKGPMGFALLIQGAMAEGYTSDEMTITPLDGGGYAVSGVFRVPR